MVDRDLILAALAQIESANGRNFNHPTITHGLNKGTNAIGRYGLTHHTVDDVVKSLPQYNNLLQMNPIQKKAYLESNPTAESAIAGNLADRLINRYNDPSKVAYAWNHGTSLAPERITPNILQNDQYTNKFNSLIQKLGGYNQLSANNIPENENNLQKDAENLPTIGMDTLEDILNDPNNPFANDFKENDDELLKSPKYADIL